MDKPLPTEVETYDDAVRWIYGRINYERVRPRTSSGHFRLDRVRHLLSLVGSPQARIPSVHIAGTKGKGSTAAMVDSILRASGIRSGLYTSPHIELFEERMKVDGRQPNSEELTDLVRTLQERLKSADDQIVEDGPTYFEVATLLAWMEFDRRRIELAVLETGLGGRLDCTNVCRPLVTVITNIGLDHTHILGDTLEKIAGEKAGILKAGIPLITGVTQPGVIAVCESKAAELDVPVERLHRDITVQESDDGTISVTTPRQCHAGLRIPLHGPHQVENAALAVATADLLSLTETRMTPQTIRCGIEQTVWPLRFEVVSESPTTILDAAHNPDAAAALVRTLDSGSWPGRTAVLIFACSRDKDAAGMLHHLLPKFDHVILTRFETNPRSRTVENLVALAESVDDTANVHTAEHPAAAMSDARRIAGSGGLICATGSIFLVAELRATASNRQLAVD